LEKRILIVEDESIVALDIQTRLEAHGYKVIGIESTGSRAVETAVEEKPDLILMDINLKGSLDGIETASLIKRSFDCPVIFLTAFSDEKTLSKARISDAFGYILKPFRESEILVTIDLVIKRAEVKKKIQKNSQWLYITLNNINDAVITVSNENNIIFLNAKAQEFLGYSLHVGDQFDKEHYISVESERTFFQKSDRKIDIEYSQTDIKEENGEILGQVYFIHDVTTVVEFEMGLEKARVAAENANRSKSDFLANVTHELRTPLNTILGMNSLLSELSTETEIQTMHNYINKAAETLLQQLNDILEFSDIESGKSKLNKGRFSIDQIIEEVVQSFQTLAQLKQLEIKIVSENNTPVLIGDKNKIKDIISCLMSNAVKFTKKGTISIHYTYNGTMLVFSIKDSGIGLTDSQKKSIFDLFTQVDGSHTRLYGGTGLGLALVSSLTELLKGVIQVESKDFAGSTFTVSLPLDACIDQDDSLEETIVLEEKEKIKAKTQPGKDFGALESLLNEIELLFEKNQYIEIDKKLKAYSSFHDHGELNYESEILFRLAVAVKLKNRDKFQLIINEVIHNSKGGVYENSYS
jgi:signal transduction histidine kinase